MKLKCKKKIYFIIFYLSLVGLLTNLTGCVSFNNYVKTRKSQYLLSKELGPIKLPKGLKLKPTQYIIPAATTRVNELPSLYPPTD